MRVWGLVFFRGLSGSKRAFWIAFFRVLEGLYQLFLGFTQGCVAFDGMLESKKRGFGVPAFTQKIAFGMCFF